MLPVVSSAAETKRQILLYTVLLVALTAMFFTTGAVGWIYLTSALALGAVFIHRAVAFVRADGIDGARSLYFYSLAYLALLFLAVMVDGIVGA